jgi:S1-C subfamily serine protease
MPELIPTATPCRVAIARAPRERQALRTLLTTALLVAAIPVTGHADQADTVDRAKSSIVAVGTFQATRNPRFQFLGTGFAVRRGDIVATCAHVIPISLNRELRETLVVALPGATSEAELRVAHLMRTERQHDIALLKLDGPPLRPMQLGSSARVRDGQRYFFTGFPIGAAIGIYPATHQALIAGSVPLAIPLPDTKQLDTNLIRRLSDPNYPIFQLDATAYPGSSGSPLYSPETGEVVGIVNMVFVKGTKEAALSSPSGISYAIPIQHLIEMLNTPD